MPSVYELVSTGSFEEFKKALTTGVYIEETGYVTKLLPNRLVQVVYPTVPDRSMWDPIVVLAARYGQKEKVELLLSHPYNVDVNSTGLWLEISALLGALWSGHQDVCNLLIEKKADIYYCFKWCLEKMYAAEMWREYAIKALANLIKYLEPNAQYQKATVITELFTKKIINSQNNLASLAEATKGWIPANEDQLVTFYHSQLQYVAIPNAVSENEKFAYARQIKLIETKREVRQWLQAEKAVSEAIKLNPKGAWGYYYLGLMYKEAQGKPHNLLLAVESLVTAVKNAEEAKDDVIKRLAITALDNIAGLEANAVADDAAAKLVQFYIECSSFQKGLALLKKRAQLNSELAALKCTCHIDLNEYSEAATTMSQVDNVAAKQKFAEQVVTRIEILRNQHKFSDSRVLAQGLVDQLNLDYGPAYYHLAELALVGEALDFDNAIDLFGKALNASVVPQIQAYKKLKEIESKKECSKSQLSKAVKHLCDFYYAVGAKKIVLKEFNSDKVSQELKELEKRWPAPSVVAEVVAVLEYQGHITSGITSFLSTAESKLTKLKTAAKNNPESFGLQLVLFDALKKSKFKTEAEVAAVADKVIRLRPADIALPQTLYRIPVVTSLREASTIVDAGDQLLKSTTDKEKTLEGVSFYDLTATKTSLYPDASTSSASSSSSSTTSTNGAATVNLPVQAPIGIPAAYVSQIVAPSAPSLETSASAPAAALNANSIGSIVGLQASSAFFTPVTSTSAIASTSSSPASTASSASATATASSSKRLPAAQENLSDAQLQQLKQKFPGVQVNAALEDGRARSLSF